MGRWSIPLLLPPRLSSQEQHMVFGGERENELDRRYQLLGLSATKQHISCIVTSILLLFMKPAFRVFNSFCFPCIFFPASLVCFSVVLSEYIRDRFGLEKQVLTCHLIH